MNVDLNNKSRRMARNSVALGIASVVLAGVPFIALQGIPKIHRFEWMPFVILGLCLASLIYGLLGGALALIVRKRSKQEDTDEKIMKLAKTALLLNTTGCICALVFFKIVLTPRISYDYSTIDHYLAP